MSTLLARGVLENAIYLPYLTTKKYFNDVSSVYPPLGIKDVIGK